MSNHVLKSGTKIGDSFEIQELLGSGGFGITYKAWDTEFERVVAIKEYFPFDLAERAGDIDTVIPRDPSKKDDFEDGLNRFVEEGRTLAKFADERIVRATRFINANGTAYMVMEYQEGCSLSTFLANNDGPLSERQLLNIFVPIMQGLAKVHRANILHRDLKPDNIYIRTDGTPLLLDFGAARQKVVGKTRSLTSVLSPGYAPFEQYHSRGNQGPWTDIYALGATLYYCVTGKNPEDATARIAARNDGKPDPMPPAAQIGSRMYSENLLLTIDWMLSLDTGQRPQSIAEVLARLPDLESEAVTKIAEQPREYVATEIIKDSSEVNYKLIGLYTVSGLLVATLAFLSYAFWPKPVGQAAYEGASNYYFGNGLAKDYTQAAKLYRKAANQGHAGAQKDLGSMYENGKGVKKDLSQAVSWYRKAANQGNASAQASIGFMYHSGKGVKKDLSQAVSWYRKAANQGSAWAQSNLGFMYENGEGVKKDFSEAVSWYRKAANQGSAWAQNNLGSMYEDGKGVKKDLSQAVSWYRKAARQGHKIAKDNLKRLGH